MDEPVGNLPIADLAIMLERGEVVLLDVRGGEQFSVAHIPGSWSVSLSELPALLRDPDEPLNHLLMRKPHNVALVTDDDDALTVTRMMLAEVNLTAAAVPGGVRAWSRAGRPVNRGSEHRVP